MTVFFAAGNVLALEKNVLYSFTVLGPQGAVARVIKEAEACPSINIDGTVSLMQLRAAPDRDFPVTVCDAAIPLAAKVVTVNGQNLMLPKARPESIAVIGDTGCRLKGKEIQGCNSVADWPFSAVANAIVVVRPDLVIHVGDYFYRETPCVSERGDCAGSPFGNNWAAWDADFFAPVGELLSAAPWVFVRGNHESCARAGSSFSRFLDPRPMPAACQPYSEPYALGYMDPQLIVMDVSSANDAIVDVEQLGVFTKEFSQISEITKKPSWLLIHAPLYGFWTRRKLLDGGGVEYTMHAGQDMLQYASYNTFSPFMQLIVAGHIYLFEALSFRRGNPPHVIVGNGGSALSPLVTTPLNGQIIAGLTVQHSAVYNGFGFVMMNRNRNTWKLSARDVNGKEVDRCFLGGGALMCDSELSQAKNSTLTWLVRAFLNSGNESLANLAYLILEWSKKI